VYIDMHARCVHVCTRTCMHVYAGRKEVRANQALVVIFERRSLALGETDVPLNHK